MPDGITIQFSPAIAAMIRSGPREIVDRAIAKALDRENEYTVGQTVRERMNFPRSMPPTEEGLRVQTGRLRRSLTRSRAVVTSEGVVSAIGSNVRYFGIHEFGFQGSVSVKAHMRKLPERYFLTTGQTITAADAKRAGLTTKQGKLRKGLGTKTDLRYVAVRSHSRQVRMPARQMVRRTVAARLPLYQLAIAEEIQKALSGPA